MTYPAAHNQWHRWAYDIQTVTWRCRDCPAHVPQADLVADTRPLEGPNLADAAARRLDRLATKQEGKERMEKPTEIEDEPLHLSRSRMTGMYLGRIGDDNHVYAARDAREVLDWWEDRSAERPYALALTAEEGYALLSVMEGEAAELEVKVEVLTGPTVAHKRRRLVLLRRLAARLDALLAKKEEAPHAH